MQYAVQRRSNLPSIFVLDDCHVDFQAVTRLMEHLHPELHNDEKYIRFVLLAGHTPVDWYEKYPGKSLQNLLPGETAAILLKTLVKRLHEKLSTEKSIELYELAGLLCYLCPDKKGHLRDYIRGELQQTEHLRDAILELSFIPAYFALYGMSLNYPFKDNFSPENCRLLIEKAGEYEQSSRLIDKLTKDLRGMIAT